MTAAPEELDALMTAAREEGDPAAYQQVVEACHHLVRSIVLRDTADPSLADEIAQEVFVRGWLKREQYQPGTNPRAWLLAIARSQVMEHHRRRSREDRHLRELVRRELLRRAAQWEPDSHDLRLQRQAALGQCVSELSDEQRELLDLVHAQGLNTGDAADVLGIAPPTCRQRLSRLQRALRVCVEARLGGSLSHG